MMDDKFQTNYNQPSSINHLLENHQRCFILAIWPQFFQRSNENLFVHCSFITATGGGGWGFGGVGGVIYIDGVVGVALTSDVLTIWAASQYKDHLSQVWGFPC